MDLDRLTRFFNHPVKFLARRQRVDAALQTRWGRLFQSDGNGQVVMPGMEPKTVIQASIGLAAMFALGAGLAFLLRKRS